MTYQPGLDGVRDKAAGHDVSTAVMISCQWELVSHQLPGRGDRQYSIGTPAFDDYVRLRYEEVADRIIAGVDRILWMTCPYLSSSTGVDVLSFSEWVNERVDDPTIRPDGSHFEFRGHNPAPDAFVDYVNAALATASV
jgi:hypothetical protein